ncbi:MAG: hypothetical protein EBQ99_03730 [Planctomycetes bacterium]|nr:hypothetical protein [Planctomycetota bacterium]
MAFVVLLGLAADPSRPDPLAHVVVMGASVSDGFGVRLRATLPDGSRPTHQVALADLIEAAARDGNIRVESLATETYFLQPEATARRTVAAALNAKPTLVIAIDWLFWNAYGTRGTGGKPMRTCEDRMALLETALNRLDQLAKSGVPMVMGDLPDMKAAIGGGMLDQSMVPSGECLKQLNDRVKAWSRAHPNVVIVQLSELVRCTQAGDPVTACGQVWSQARLGPLLQQDKLHPTLVGSMAVLAMAIDGAQRVTGQPVTGRFDLDPSSVRSKLLQRIAEGAGKLDPDPSPAPPTAPETAGHR